MCTYVYMHECVCKYECISGFTYWHSQLIHVSFVGVTCLIHLVHESHSYVWHDSYPSVTRLVHTSDKIRWWTSFTYEGVMQTHEWVMSLIQINHATHINESCLTHEFYTLCISIITNSSSARACVRQDSYIQMYRFTFRSAINSYNYTAYSHDCRTNLWLQHPWDH